MTEQDIPRMIYLVLLGLLILGFGIGPGRRTVGQQVKHVLTWAGIFLLLVAAYGQRDIIMAQLFPTRPQELEGGTIAINRSPGGSFEATLQINGVPIRFLVDTGATDIVLSLDDARRAGIDPDRLNYDRSATTANGVVRTASVRLDSVQFAGHVVRDVPASVNSGDLGLSLLGMSYLDQFRKIEISGDRMLLIR